MAQPRAIRKILRDKIKRAEIEKANTIVARLQAVDLIIKLDTDTNVPAYKKQVRIQRAVSKRDDCTAIQALADAEITFYQDQLDNL